MVDGAEDDVSVAREVLSAVAVLLDGVAAGEAAAVQPHQHRTFLGVQAGRPHVQLQAVLADQVVVPVVLEEGHRLDGAVVPDRLRGGFAVIHRRAHARPLLRLLRRHEAVLAGRRGAVRDAFELVDVAQDEAADLAGGRLGDGDVVTDEKLLAVRRRLGGPASAAEQGGACQTGQGEMELVHVANRLMQK